MGRGTSRPIGSSGRPPGRRGGAGSGPTNGGSYGGGRVNGIGGGGSMGGSKKGACDMWIPIAIPALLFYALPRMFFDWLRGQ